MVVTYPQPPAPRIAYDLDGSDGFVFGLSGANGVQAAQPAWLGALNADTGRVARVYSPAVGSRTTTGIGFAIRLSAPMRLRAVAFGAVIAISSSSTGASYALGLLETSTDSTNGVDGTWRTLKSYLVDASNDFTYDLGRVPAGEYSSIDPAYRENDPAYISRVLYTGTSESPSPNTLSLFYVPKSYRRAQTNDDRTGWWEVDGHSTRNVRWVRFRTSGPGNTVIPYPGYHYMAQDTGVLFKLHLYGEPDTNASETRLSMVNASGAPIGSTDFGDSFAGDVKTQQFRIKNESELYTARSVEVLVAPPNPSIVEQPETWLRLSSSTSTAQSSIELGDLAPGAVSELVTLTLKPTNSMLGPTSPRLAITAEEWT